MADRVSPLLAVGSIWSVSVEPGAHRGPLDSQGGPHAGDDWVTRLSTSGTARDGAVADLHGLMLRAARHRISRMTEAAGLGSVRREEIAQAAADDATMSVLGRLHTFEGRSRFTTWAYKFAILQAGVELRRALWKDRDIPLAEIGEPLESPSSSPEALVEAADLATAVRSALATLTPHQRQVATALLVDDVPIDVLAERLGTNRNALYKTLHDARQRLRTQLESTGFRIDTTAQGGSR